MGIVEINNQIKAIFIRAHIYFYGNAANEFLTQIVVNDMNVQWNEPNASMQYDNDWYRILFELEGTYAEDLQPMDIMTNDNPMNNYFRIEEYARGNISFVDGIGSNTGYFLRENLLYHSTTATHEFGHSLGLTHPMVLDIRGRGTPGIMYPRGTIVDPEYQYDPSVPPGTKGGTLNPFKRKVLLSDIENLGLHRLDFRYGSAVLGDFTSVWHEAQRP